MFIKDNSKYGTRMTEDTKANIKKWHKEGKTMKWIHKETGHSLNTIHRHIKKHVENK